MPLSLQLKVTSVQRDQLPNNGVFTVDAQGATLGRSASCDIVLDDPDKVVSGQHAEISLQDGVFVVTDQSTNGLFIDNDSAPLGRGVSCPLASGTVMGIGEYQLMVELLEESAISPPDVPPPSWDGAESDPITRGADTSSIDADNGLMQAGFDPLAPASGSIHASKLAIPDDFLTDQRPATPEPSASQPTSDELLGNSHDDPFSGGGDVAATPTDTFGVAHSDPLSDPFVAPSNHLDTNLAGGTTAVSQDTASGIPEDWMLDDDVSTPNSSAPVEASPPVPPPIAAQASSELNDADPFAAAKSNPGITTGTTPDDAVLLPDEAEPQFETFDPLAGTTAPPQDSVMVASIPEVASQPEQAPSSTLASAEITDWEAPEPVVAESAPMEVDPPPAAHQNDDTGAAQAATLAGSALENYLLAGLMDLLAARAEMKNEFRMERTIIRQEENNPLKFAPNVDVAKSLFADGAGSAYLSAEQAVLEGVADIKQHQLALMIGMRAAFTQLVKTLNPSNFESGQNAGGLSKLVSSDDKRAWQAYKDFYRVRVGEADDPFDELFGRALADAYQAAIVKK